MCIPSRLTEFYSFSIGLHIMDILYYAGLAATGFIAGLLGALLGLGGGVFVVPALVLGFRLPALMAVGTSNVAVIATSITGASTYVRTASPISGWH